MHRIDGAGATVDKKFTEGDPAGGVQATVVTASWLNDVQENLVAVIVAAGIVPTKGRVQDLVDAITINTSGRLIGVQLFTVNGTYTPTSGTTFVIVEGCGGGGAGGGAPITAAGNVGFGCGGNAGAYGKGRFTVAQIGASQPVTVGNGGVGNGGTGGTGGQTSLGVLITWPGGAGGPTAGNTAPPLIANNGNSPAVGNSGNNMIRGAGPISTMALCISVTIGFSGQGASGPYGCGGPAINSTSNGVSGAGYGSGGSGAMAFGGNAAQRLGGNGSPSFCLIMEYA